MQKRLILIFFPLVAGLVFGGMFQAQAQLPTSTPASIRLSSITPLPEVIEATVEDSFAISGETATPRNIVMLEPISEVNVRSSPEIAEDNQLGVIRAGERYTVLGQYFNWVQLQYDLAPTGRAWVYRDLVTIVGGDISTIPTLIPNATPTQDPSIANATQTQTAILGLPGGELTVTAQARVIQLPGGDGQIIEGNVNSAQTPLPTFTYPPRVLVGVPTLAATREFQDSVVNANSSQPGGVPPIIPILGLGGLGMLGVAISLLRR